MREQGVEIEEQDKDIFELIKERQLLLFPPSREEMTLPLTQIAAHFKRPKPFGKKDVNRQEYFSYIFKNIMSGVDITPYLYDPTEEIKHSETSESQLYSDLSEK